MATAPDLAEGKHYCGRHNKVLKFYCETCKVLVCRHCMEIDHTRPEHTWFPLADVVAQHKLTLNASSSIFERQKSDAAEGNCKIEQAMETLKNNTTKAKAAIKQQQQSILNAFTEKLEKETKAWLDQIDKKCTEANELLLNEQADVKAYFENAGSWLDYTKNILSDGNDQEIVLRKDEIEKKAGSIVNVRPELKEPVHDGLLEYHPKPNKDVFENLKLNDLGKIGMCKY